MVVLYPLTEWLGSFSAVGELRLLIFAVVVLLVLLFMPRGLTPLGARPAQDSVPALQAANPVWREALTHLRRSAAGRRGHAHSEPEVAGAQRLRTLGKLFGPAPTLSKGSPEAEQANPLTAILDQ